MPPRQKPARIVFWRGDWYFFFRDAGGRARRIHCESMGCTNEAQRARQLKLLREREAHDAAARLRLGSELDYSHNLIHAIGLYIEHTDGRRDIAEASKRETHKAVEPFSKWLAAKHPSLTTGALGGQVVAAYLNGLTQSAATVNKSRRQLKAMLRWLATVRPRLFPEIDHLMPALKQEYVERRDSVAFTPSRLRAMRSALDPDQRRLFTFLAVTGCRLSEALALDWEDVDLERGRIRFRITKTGRTRVLPLIGAPEGQVGPALLKAMKKWPRPCGALHRRDHWRNKGVCNPQALRQNWVSYAASIGIPASVAAMWAGHSAAVAEQYYRMQVLERNAASSIEAAMGLT